VDENYRLLHLDAMPELSDSPESEAMTTKYPTVLDKGLPRDWLHEKLRDKLYVMLLGTRTFDEADTETRTYEYRTLTF
jgi:hypothetical protein